MSYVSIFFEITSLLAILYNTAFTNWGPKLGIIKLLRYIFIPKLFLVFLRYPLDSTIEQGGDKKELDL